MSVHCGVGLEYRACESPARITGAQAILAGILDANRLMRESGECARWLEGADEELKNVVKDVNGPLLQALLEASGYEDVSCVELLRVGWSLRSPRCESLLLL